MFSRNYNRIFEASLYLILIFTPLAYGSVLPWSYKAVASLVFLLLAMRIAKGMERGGISFPKTSLLLSIPAIFFYFLLNLFPLPYFIVTAISPGRADMRAAAGVNGFFEWLSVNPAMSRNVTIFFLSAVILLFLVADYCKNRERIKNVLILVLLIGTALAVNSLARKATGHGLKSFLPYVNRNHFAGYMELTVAVGAAVLYMNLPQGFFSRNIMNSFISLFSNRLGVRIVAILFCMAVMASALVASGSRGGMIGLAFSLIVFGMLSSRRKVAAIIISATLFIGLAVAVISLDAGSGLDRIGTLADVADDMTTDFRYQIWSNTLEMYKSAPVTGVGAGGFESAFPFYKTIRREVNIFQPESDYLYFLTEVGAVGFILVMAFFLYFIKIAFLRLKERRDTLPRAVTAGALAALSAMLLHGLVDTNLHIPANLLLVMVLLGIAYTSVHTSFRHSSRTVDETVKLEIALTGSRRRFAYALMALSVILSVYCATSGAGNLIFRYTMDDRKALIEQKSNNSADWARLISNLDTARLLDPGNGSYDYEKGVTYSIIADDTANRAFNGEKITGPSSGDTYKMALDSFRDSLNLFHYSAFAHLLSARMCEKLGEETIAAKEYETAQALGHENAFIVQNLMRFYYNSGNFKLYKKYAALLPRLDIKYNPVRDLFIISDAADNAATIGDKVNVTVTARLTYGKLRYKYSIRRIGSLNWVEKATVTGDNTWEWDTSDCSPGPYFILVHADSTDDKALPADYIIQDPIYLHR